MKKNILLFSLILVITSCKDTQIPQLTFEQRCENSIRESLVIPSEENVFWCFQDEMIIDDKIKNVENIQFSYFEQINVPLSEIDSLYRNNSNTIPPSRLSENLDKILQNRYTPTNYSVRVQFSLRKTFIEGGGTVMYFYLCYLNDNAQIMGCIFK